MDFSHEMYPRDGHGRRAASTSVIGPIERALPGLHLTVSYRPGPSSDLKTTYSYPKAGHSRRAASTRVIGPWVCVLCGRKGRGRAVMLQIKPQYNINYT
ncbi:hypothetical protein DPMN_186448 [Dreissena polymorpha]|uniref:Uncharacterized protein n=1 Tax=Dreissena polymorpha TaxID=45954 RepID=A0A9D4I872_DREPO|nr:hypothetical protein DPMN_186448 [Dreissena polymorpha]